MGRHGKTLLLVAFNLALTLGLLEAGGLMLYWSETGQLFYGRSVSSAAQQTIDSPFARAEMRPVLHPYFGYVYTTRDGSRRFQSFHLNNHYFVQDRGYAERHSGCCDFPYRKRSADEFVIGIFGGSVANAVAVTAQFNDFLPKLLAESPSFANRRVTVLSFAVGGHKQPQQLEILSYYLSLGQMFDAVVNIDGFNEIGAAATNASNRFAVSYPNAHIWGTIPNFLDSQAVVPSAAALSSVYHRLGAARSANAMSQCWLTLCYLWHRAEGMWHASQAGATSKATASYFAIEPARAEDWAEATADQWARSVGLMHAQLDALHIPFVEVIQPNIWFRATPYTGKPASHNKSEVEKGYPALLARVPQLRARHVDVIDATAMFDSRTDVYSDDCCHFNEAGNQEIVRRVAKWLVDRNGGVAASR